MAYRGNAAIRENRKGEIVLKPDVDGKYNAANVQACYDRIIAVSKSEKLKINEYTIFTPKDAKGKLIPVMLPNPFGNPYIALLPERDAGKGKKLRDLG